MDIMSIVTKVVIILLGFIPIFIARQVAYRYYHPLPHIRHSDISRGKPYCTYKSSSPIIAMAIEFFAGTAIYILAHLCEQNGLMIFVGTMISALYLALVELFVGREIRPVLMYDAYAICIILYLFNII